jgi:hypothetical protein
MDNDCKEESSIPRAFVGVVAVSGAAFATVAPACIETQLEGRAGNGQQSKSTIRPKMIDWADRIMHTGTQIYLFYPIY